MNTSYQLFLIAVMGISGWATGCQVPASSGPATSPHSVPAPGIRSAEEDPPGVARVSCNEGDEIKGGVWGRGSCGSQWAMPGGSGPRDVFREERRDFFPMLGRDAKGLLNWHDMALLGGALGGAIAIRQDWDAEVRDYVQEHPQRWNPSSKLLGYTGEVQYQVPVLLGVYGYSLYSADDELHELSKALLSAYTITGLSTLTVKAIADTERPSPEWNDGQFGFPSFHTASSFSVAAVVEEYCGLPTALPVYTVAGLIGWSRMDEQDHDLSDVVFGAALGYVIGKSIAKQHKNRNSKMRLKPYQHPLESAGGIAAEWRY